MDINGLRRQKAERVDAMEAIISAAQKDNRVFTDDENKSFDDHRANIVKFDEQIKRIEEFNATKAATVRPVDQPAEPAKPAPAKTERAPGHAISRIIRSLAAARGNPRDAAEHCEKVYGDGEVAKALAAGTGSAGGFLVPDQFSAELIEFLRPASVIRRMNPVLLPMPNGNMTLPKQTGGGSADYVGENNNITPSEQTFGQLKLTARKLAALTPISNDLIRFSSPAADNVVRDDLVNAVAQAEDSNFIRGLGTGAGPKGLRYWAPTANVLTVNATVNLANITVDLGRLVLALKNGNTRMIRPGWLMAPRTELYLMTVRDGNGNYAFRAEMLTGRLWGYPYGVTTQIPINLAVTGTAESEVYLADFADVVLGEVPGLIINVSDTAAYHNGSAVVAPFSLDQTVIRVIAQHDLGMRHSGSVAVLSDVDWV